MAEHFRRIQQGVETERLLDEIEARPEVWTVDAQRQSQVQVQRETQTVPIRLHREPVTFREARQRHPIRYVGRPTPVARELPGTAAFVDSLMQRFHGLSGRAAIVRLKPHGRVYEHIDQGLYYQLRDRYHLVLRSRAGSRLRAGPEEVRMQEGELWWFDNRLPHEASNDSDEPRIHLIVDVLSPGSIGRFLTRTLTSPGRTLLALRRKLTKALSRRRQA